MTIRAESRFRYSLLQTLFVFLTILIACSPATPIIPSEEYPNAPIITDNAMNSSDTLYYLPLIFSGEEDPTAVVEDTVTSTPLVNILPITPTMSETSCAIAAGWFTYIVKSGDTLSAIGRLTGATVQELKNANCMVSDVIYPGDILYVPHLPVTATYTFKPPDTPTYTNTPKPPPPNRTRTSTPTSTFIPPDTPTHTNTPKPPPPRRTKTPTPTLADAASTPTLTPPPKVLESHTNTPSP